MTAYTPIATAKTAALARILDSVPKGYHRYTHGAVAAEKAARLIRKLHERHGIGDTPARRITRKQHGRASALLVVYWPEGAAAAQWLMLFTPGELDSPEKLCNVTDKQRLQWLGYELVRRPNQGAASWTWRRTKVEMAELYNLLDARLAKRHYSAIAEDLQRIARQPGFHGVREQSWTLCQYAARKGYLGQLPQLYYMQKVSHGTRWLIERQCAAPAAPAAPQAAPAAVAGRAMER